MTTNAEFYRYGMREHALAFRNYTQRAMAASTIAEATRYAAMAAHSLFAALTYRDCSKPPPLHEN